jgi:hypothetical protein
MSGFSQAAAIVTQNRASRRLAAKLGLKLPELMIGFAGGLITQGQRRITADIKKRIRWRLAKTKKEISEVEVPE